MVSRIRLYMNLQSNPYQPDEKRELLSLKMFGGVRKVSSSPLISTVNIRPLCEQI